jgi:hypothetical protein
MLAGSTEALVAQPASTRAASRGSSAVRSFDDVWFMMNSCNLMLVVIREA